MNRLKGTALGRKMAALLTLTVFLLGLMVQPALALDFGVYTATTTTNYLNPDTGVTEDGGTQNVELGEGMCRSAVGETALIEVDASGNTYVTMRMLLYSNLSKIKFYVQDKPGGSYSQVKASITAEDSSNDSADFRMKVPSAGANVKTVMYVAPMGRDVVFFWNVNAGTAKSGSGDFAVNINLNAKPKAEEPKQEEVKQEPAKTTVSEPVKAEAKTEPAATAEPVKTETKTETKTEVKQETKTEQADSSQTAAVADEKEDVNTEDSKTSEQSEEADVTEKAVNEEGTESDEPVIENEEESNADDEAAVTESEEAPAEEGGLPVVPIVCVAAVAAVGAVVLMRKK